MKVCHLTSVHPRHDTRILEKECVSLAKEGYEVYLIANDGLKNEIYKNVHIISTGYSPKSRLSRLFLSSRIVVNEALRIDADLYHLHDPELLSIISKLKKNNKVVIFDAHEDTEEQIRDKYWIPHIFRSIISFLYRCVAYKKMKIADAVITVTPQLVEKFGKYNENVRMITNYPIMNNNRTTKLKKCDDKYVFFAGGINEQWCHKYIAKALEYTDEIKFYFAGKSDNSEYLSDLLTYKSSCYLGLISHDDVMDYYEESLAGMAILNCSQVGREGTLGNTKLFEVMQAGKPVICSNLTLWREIIEKYKCGICVDYNDVSAITRAIKFLIDNPNTAKEMGENGKKAVADVFNWTTQERELLSLYSVLMVD